MAELGDRLQAGLGTGYRVERELGGGGMSRVFLAEEVDLGRQVVVKVLPPEMAAGVNVDRFRREIQLAARLQHPHVVPLLTAGASGDLLYYVMPFIKGESLRAKLAREGELPIGEAARILRDVADALAYAHGEGVVHRDIKPDNVLLSGHHAVVTDFGVAKAVSASTGSSSLTSLGVALGTPAYMAPEQAVADPHVDHRADIYALGALGYEILTGRPPFTGANPQAVLAAHVTEAAEPVTKHRDTVPPALNEVIMRCLAKKAADRWQSAEELRAQFEAMVTPTGGITPTGTQPVLAAAAAAARKAHPIRVAGLFGLASVGVLAIVYAAVQLMGLPDWVFWGAIGLLVLGLPVVLVTGRRERQRAIATMTGVRLATPTGLERHFTWHTALWGGGLAFAGLALVAAVYMAMRLLGIGPVGTLIASGTLGNRERLLVADVVNATSDTALGKTVTDLLRIALRQSRVVNVMEREQVADVLERMRRNRDTPLTAELASEVAAREGIKAYVAGEIRSVGTGYLLSARLVVAQSGDAPVAVSEQVNGQDDLIKVVGRVSAQLRERIGESLRSVRADPPLEQVTTTSLEALQLYAQATEMSNRGDARRAVALLKEAVARDSLFAMAWRRMGAYMTTNAQLGVEMREEGIAALRRAYALRDRLSARERYHVEALYQSNVQNDNERAVTSYLALLQQYPDDPTALNNLAVTYGSLGRFVERDDAYRRAIATGQALATTYTNLLASLRGRGLPAVADTVLDQFAAKYPDNPATPQTKAGLAGDRMQWDEVVRIAREAGAKYPTLDVWALNTQADVARLRGQLHEADRLREQAIRTNAPRFNVSPEDREFRIELDRTGRRIWFSDNRAAYAAQVEALWQRNLRLTSKAPPPVRRYPQFVALFAEVGRLQRARQLVAEFKGLLGQRLLDLPNNRIGMRQVDGYLALADGRPRDAVVALREVREEDRECGFCNLVQLADAYDQAGDADSALAYYRRYLTTPGARMGMDADWLARSLRRLGELEEAKGDREKALEYYGRFVDLWRNADPNLQPLVQDAKQRIARLVEEGGPR